MTVLTVAAAATICAGLAHVVTSTQGVKQALRAFWRARMARIVAALSPLNDLFDPYRPERHYMRGPGPKWHAKHVRVTHQDRRRY